MKKISHTFLAVTILVFGIILYDGKILAEGFYCNVPGAPCETLNVNDCRSIYFDWETTGACTVSYLDIESCGAATSCTY